LPACDKAARKLLLDKDNFIWDNGALYHLYRPRTKKLDRCFAEIRQYNNNNNNNNKYDIANKG